jgi:N-acetylglucosaminyl-diphospho-decaprenol L-rhamnosyltransferase
MEAIMSSTFSQHEAAPPVSPPLPVQRLRPRRCLGKRRGVIDVSVCIANWNGQEVLARCLESLLRQPQGVRLEVVVVDNGSTDGATELVARRFPEVVLIANVVNRGFARANNQAAARARGRYLFFLNNDTEVPAGTLGRLLAYAEAHPEVGMIGPRLRGPDGRVQVSYRPRPSLRALLHPHALLRWTGLFRSPYRHYRRGQFDPDHPRHVETLMGAALFLPRRIFLQCGPWDEDFTFGGEDLHLSACVARHHPLLYWPEAEVVHHGGVSSRLHGGPVTSARAAGLVCYLRRAGYGRGAVLGYKVAVTLDAPAQFLYRGAKYLASLLRLRRHKNERDRLGWQGACHFLTRGLGDFWKA